MIKTTRGEPITAPSCRASYIAEELWDDAHLGRLIAETAARTPEKIAVVDLDGSRSSTYADLDIVSTQVAQLLLQLGVEPGEVVSVQLPNWFEGVAVGIGILKAGAVLGPLVPQFRARELGYMLGIANVRVLFTPDHHRGFDFRVMVNDVRTLVPSFKHNVVVPNPQDGRLGFRRWLDKTVVSGGSSNHVLDATALSHLVFTSGTESAPKAVMHTEQTLNASVRLDNRWFGLESDDVIWVPSPIGHLTGLGRGVRLALYNGMTAVLQDKWDPAVGAMLIERFRCTFTTAATTFVSDLVKHLATSPADTSSLRFFMSGGAPVPSEVVRAASAVGLTILRQYGGTEMRTVTANRPEMPEQKRVETDGPILDHVEIELRDEDGARVNDRVGEIYTRSPASAVGFLRDPERTEAVFGRDGWVRTGDLGRFDSDGYLTVVGRVKEIIIRGGVNIAPREIEDVLVQHPAIAEAAVIGLPDDRLGEITCACVVLCGADTPALRDIVEYLRGRGMAAFKLPARLVILDSIPKTPTGKVSKPDLMRCLPAQDGPRSGRAAEV